jgi:hypothetical protein
MMYALINTMNAIQGDSIGTVLSQHRTIAAAERANDTIQRMTKRANGSSSYLPTTIVWLTRKPAGRWLGNDEWTAVES